MSCSSGTKAAITAVLRCGNCVFKVAFRRAGPIERDPRDIPARARYHQSDRDEIDTDASLPVSRPTAVRHHHFCRRLSSIPYRFISTRSRSKDPSSTSLEAAKSGGLRTSKADEPCPPPPASSDGGSQRDDCDYDGYGPADEDTPHGTSAETRKGGFALGDFIVRPFRGSEHNGVFLRAVTAYTDSERTIEVLIATP